MGVHINNVMHTISYPDHAAWKASKEFFVYFFERPRLFICIPSEQQKTYLPADTSEKPPSLYSFKSIVSGIFKRMKQ